MIFQMIVIFFSGMLWNEMEYTFHFLVVTGEFFLECTWIKHSGSFYSKKLHSSCSQRESFHNKFDHERMKWISFHFLLYSFPTIPFILNSTNSIFVYQLHPKILTLTIEGVSLVERFTGKKCIFGILRWIDATSANLVMSKEPIMVRIT